MWLNIGKMVEISLTDFMFCSINLINRTHLTTIINSGQEGTFKCKWLSPWCSSHFAYPFILKVALRSSLVNKKINAFHVSHQNSPCLSLRQKKNFKFENIHYTPMFTCEQSSSFLCWHVAPFLYIATISRSVE